MVHRIQPSRALPSRLRRLIRRAWRCSVSCLFLTGCVSQMVCDSPMDPCVVTGGASEAIMTAAAASALWVGGGGCAIAGCRYPFVCNAGSGLCEHLRCDESGSSCPTGTSCDSLTYTCR